MTDADCSPRNAAKAAGAATQLARRREPREKLTAFLVGLGSGELAGHLLVSIARMRGWASQHSFALSRLPNNGRFAAFAFFPRRSFSRTLSILGRLLRWPPLSCRKATSVVKLPCCPFMPPVLSSSCRRRCCWTELTVAAACLAWTRTTMLPHV